ncbi:septum formation protein Maf [Hyphomicrobium methylovorum]|uniref:Maf family protein n=1 Tax=Hyphomicrobium methylovorum TaxID=84 RepID=UPI0015E66D23|nr:Maf family nucleotide pyrophosphatase [Hyphomicrobium methylovorum]MBA2126131.1 septum formation protein Maf [Hyphomicrobium methylovorum]
MSEANRLILASGSAARRSMLEAAGLTFRVVPADVDEPAIRTAAEASGKDVSPAAIAGLLASEKAQAVSRAYPEALVIGADQVLAFENRILSKEHSISGARQTLLELRGKSHMLVSAVALARNGAVVWQSSDTAKLTMRNFSTAFLESYLENSGERILSCVGCYELEGLGVQLFERIEGDYFTILGLPLLPLLACLRDENMVLA